MLKSLINKLAQEGIDTFINGSKLIIYKKYTKLQKKFIDKL